MREYVRPLVDEDDDWCAAPTPVPRSGLPMRAAMALRRTIFSAIEWVGHASKLQPDDEGIDDIHAEVMNSHSLVKTIGTVFGAYLGWGGVTAGDLPPKAVE